jgi:hypothetical protein
MLQDCAMVVPNPFLTTVNVRTVDCPAGHLFAPGSCTAQSSFGALGFRPATMAVQSEFRTQAEAVIISFTPDSTAALNAHAPAIAGPPAAQPTAPNAAATAAFFPESAVASSRHFRQAAITPGDMY